MLGLVDARRRKGVAELGGGGANGLHPDADTGATPRQQRGACQRSHRDLQLPCGHLRQPLEDAVCNAALQPVEGRHVAAYRRHMAALILLQMHQRIVVHLSGADSVIDRRDYDAVDGIGDAGRRPDW